MDTEKEQRIILAIETAQLELKKIIQRGILLQMPREEIKALVLTLIDTTKIKLKEYEADDELIKDTEFAIKRSFILWYNNLYAKLTKALKNAISQQIEAVKQIKPIATKETKALTITDEGLKKQTIANVREFQTISEEGGASYYYNYAERVEQVTNELASLHLGVDKNSLRNRAEIKVRYDAINEDLNKLKDKGIKFVISSAHANASERCSWWQGKIFELDIDIATREMGQYDGEKPVQHIKGYIDGKPYYSLKEACENGFLSYNCQHRLIAYYKGIHIQQYDMVKVEKKRNISQTQRYLERNIRQLRTRMELATNEEQRKMFHKEVIQLQREYKEFCKSNNVPIYEWRTKIID